MRSRWALCLFVASGCQQLFGLQEITYEAPPDAAPCPARSVATGRGHTCSVDYRGRVYCWGINDAQQAQTSTTEFVLTPSAIGLPGPATQVTAGRDFNCALLEDRSVWCWGANDYGELGEGAASTSPAPRKISGIPAAAEVRAGGYHACARSADDGAVWCWGRNRFGQIGVDFVGGPDCGAGPTDPCETPTLVPNTAGSKRLALGHSYSCVIDKDDYVACWGRNNNGQLGQTASVPVIAASRIETIGTVRDISASGKGMCAIDSIGTVRCWGNGDDGQLGTGTFESSASPLPTLVENARSIAVGGFGACAALDDNTVSCWGSHDGGNGTNGTTATPRPSLVVDPIELASGYFHSCTIARGDVACWGNDQHGQLGRGARDVTLTPVDVPGTAGTAQVAVGRDHACALSTTGAVTCWGDNDYGEAGNAALDQYYAPTPVAQPISIAFGLHANYNHTCVWGAGEAACWGRASNGVLGSGQSERSQVPTKIIRTGIDSLSVGDGHLCLLTQLAEVWCYGSNIYGQLGGPRSMTTSASGIEVSLTNPTRVAIGGRHSCAIHNSGTVSCWGRNADGQLGNATTADSEEPVLSLGLGVAAVDIGAGNDHTCALLSNSTVYCWGRNVSGQLGLGTRTGQTMPQAVALPGPVAALTVGPNATCARIANGDVYCWGDGDFGQLGTGTSIDRDVPTIVPGYATASSVAMGLNGSCAVVGGSVRCSGQNRFLGNGDASRSTPMRPNLPPVCSQ